jgi:hypothetical protein
MQVSTAAAGGTHRSRSTIVALGVGLVERPPAAGPCSLACREARRERGRMADTDHIANLQARIDRLEAKQAELYEQLAEARLDQWKGRLEDLEVQVHLGAMDTNDRIDALVSRARDRWNEAKAQLSGATCVASDVFETVRSGFESALSDIRRALLDAKKQATS